MIGRRVFGALVAAALLCGSLSACAKGDASGVGVVPKNEPFPVLVGRTLENKPLSTESLAGRPLVVNVWATWCDPCRREQPDLQSLHEGYGDRVGFVGINYRDTRTLARGWVKEFGVTYPSFFDQAGRFAAVLDFPFAPDTYVVDSTGTLRYVIFGETNEEELGGLIDEVLALPKRPASS